jgi:hypothetical protein
MFFIHMYLWKFYVIKVSEWEVHNEIESIYKFRTCFLLVSSKTAIVLSAYQTTKN